MLLRQNLCGRMRLQPPRQLRLRPVRGRLREPLPEAELLLLLRFSVARVFAVRQRLREKLQIIKELTK